MDTSKKEIRKPVKTNLFPPMFKVINQIKNETGKSKGRLVEDFMRTSMINSEFGPKFIDHLTFGTSLSKEDTEAYFGEDSQNKSKELEIILRKKREIDLSTSKEAWGSVQTSLLPRIFDVVTQINKENSFSKGEIVEYFTLFGMIKSGYGPRILEAIEQFPSGTNSSKEDTEAYFGEDSQNKSEETGKLDVKLEKITNLLNEAMELVDSLRGGGTVDN